MANTAASAITKTILLEISRRWPCQSLCWRQNVTKAMLPTRTGLRAVRSAPNGTADIIGCVCGRPVAIEVKAGRDKLSEAQERWRDAWIAAGGVYVEAREVAMAMECLAGQVDGAAAVRCFAPPRY